MSIGEGSAVLVPTQICETCPRAILTFNGSLQSITLPEVQPRNVPSVELLKAPPASDSGRSPMRKAHQQWASAIRRFHHALSAVQRKW